MAPFSFLKSDRENAPIQLYGKLPLAKDYLRISCGEGTGRVLREWLDAGFGAAQSVEDQLVLGEPLRFVGGGEEDPVQGLLWPSGDSGGHRKFPFTLFVTRRAKALEADLGGELGESEGLWTQLAEVREECAEFEDGSRMLSALRRRKLEVPADGVPLTRVDYRTWLQGCWPAEESAGLFEVMSELEQLVSARYRGPLRLPVVRDLPMRDQVLGWLSLLGTLKALPGQSMPWMFFPHRSMARQRGRSFLLIVGGPLHADHAAWLLPPTERLGEGDFCAPFDEEEPDLSSPPEAPSSLAEALTQAFQTYLAGRIAR